ncbi:MULTISPECIES: hypothetical protein [Burkholderia]|uniref:hypothetical protein n=1 Tax=Burkholderia TaxID=32008 RepID=UPI00163F73BA|nr:MULTISPECIES: hypothetical protein [Burkholderia]MBJ9926422.1 hypothetical protein [Burkholderia cenocepacia]MCA8180688.1 hypothetical protein [Burkholderia vietnamiensis]UVS90856.1 hypothetical protein EFP17_14415 [Burkholderia glumae]
MTTTFNFADDLKIDVLHAGSLENYVSNEFDEHGNRIEDIDGYFTFYELAVEAFGRTFNVRTQEEPDGTLLVPSNEFIGEMGSDKVTVDSEYFALLQALVKKHLGIDYSDEDHEDNDWVMPGNIEALHQALVAHLKAVLTEHIAATA